MAETKSSSEPSQPGPAPASQISNIFGPIRLLPGESADIYKAGLIGTIKELGATTHLQTYLAEKIFQCLWWICRYEIQKQACIFNEMVRLASKFNTSESTKSTMAQKLQDHLWDDKELKKLIQDAGHTGQSLTAKAMKEVREEIQKLDMLIALRVKTLGQLQQSYEALVNRSVMQERLKLQNELLKRDLQAIDVPAVVQASVSKSASLGQRKAKSGQ
jgi:hypothetical protein